MKKCRIEKWGETLALLYNNVTKPLLDVILYSKELYYNIGWEGPVYTFGFYILTGGFLRLISPTFGRLTTIEQSFFFLF